MPQVTEDHDSPWKEALELFFQSFLQLLYPDLHEAIDWSRPFAFLDKELQKLTPDSHTGRRQADKLVQVWFRDNSEHWLLIHVEVQGEKEAAFPERMFVYYYRILDRYRQDVISLAVLADTDPRYRPDSFDRRRAGSGVHFAFRTVKLLDFRDRMDELLASDNPFALLVAAQLTAKLIKDNNRRVDNLIGFYRLAIRKNLDQELIERLLVFLEWLIALPPEIKAYYTERVDLLKEENTVPYVSMLEQIGIERGFEKGIEKGMEKGLEEGIRIGEDRGRTEGLQEGLQEGRAAILLHQLQLKFGELPGDVRQRVAQADQTELDLWAERILFAHGISEIFQK